MTPLPGLGRLLPFREAPRACAVHPSRPAVGLCRSCCKAGCGECLTKVDGVNRCAVCIVQYYPVRRLPQEALRQLRPRRRVPRSLLRVGGALSLYAVLALFAAAVGVLLPFSGNERRLAANRQRMAEVALAVSTYYNDVGSYPTPERGLKALLDPDRSDRERWKGPYTTARATGGDLPKGPTDRSQVLDVFGRAIVYYASPVDPDRPEALPETIYLASPGGNGTFETPGVGSAQVPHQAAGDDVVQWIAWP